MHRIRFRISHIPPHAERIFFLLGLAFLSFVAGAACVHFQLEPGRRLKHAFKAAEALYEKERIIREAAQTPINETLPPGNMTLSVPERSYGGLTLLTGKSTSAAILIDEQGHTVHRWLLPFSRIWPDPPHISRPLPDSYIYLNRALVMPNGDLVAVYISQGDTPYGYGLARMDKDSRLIWRYDGRAHHDLSMDREGRIYALTQRIATHPIEGFESLVPPLLEDFVVILSPEGRELNTVSVLEAFRNSPFKHLISGTYGNRDGDYLHTNTVQVIREEAVCSLPGVKPGQVFISLRNQHLIAIVDMQSRSVVWASRGPWRMQHQPECLPGGHILLFDNGGAASAVNRVSRVLEIDPRALSVVWSYSGSDGNKLQSSVRGMQQQLPNGNILITESNRGRVLEVSRKGDIVWEYRAHIGKDEPLTGARRYRREDLPFLSQP